jgi:Rad3-related DNA helicase
MAEGIDLADDAARFCIFPKVPWPDMGDPYVKARMKRHPDWLSNKTALDLVQGSGRVVRHNRDHGETYIFDSSFDRLVREAKFPRWWLDALVIGKKPPAGVSLPPETPDRSAIRLLTEKEDR